MKYSELTIEQARAICKKDKYCETCRLRRTRTDKDGKEHTLFCAFILKNMYEYDDSEYARKQIEELMNEEIAHYND